MINVLRETITNPAQIATLNRLYANGNAVFEACAFQDITGQRVSKIVKSVIYVEERVNALVDIWSKDKLATIELAAEPQKSADEDLLYGLQLDGEACRRMTSTSFSIEAPPWVSLPPVMVLVCIMNIDKNRQQSHVRGLRNRNSEANNYVGTRPRVI